MSPYWKMFEPRVPGFVHIPTCYPYRQEGAKPGRDGGADRGAPARGGDPPRGAGHGGGLHRRADPRRRRRALSHRRLLPARAPGLRPAPGAVHRRRGDHRLLPHRQVVRASSTGTSSPTSCRSPRACRRAICRSAASWCRKAIKEAMDSVKPEDRWMHAYTYSGHPTCCAVGLKNIEIMERERLWERAATMGKRLHDGLHAGLRRPPARGRHPRRQGAARRGRAGGGQGDQGELRRPTRRSPRGCSEMTKRGVVTRARPVSAHRPRRHDLLRAAAGGDRQARSTGSCR